MPIIGDNDIISQGALQRPSELATELDKVYINLTKILKASKESEAAIVSARSVSKVSQETDKLVLAQKNLVTEQNNAVKATVAYTLAQKNNADQVKQVVNVYKAEENSLISLTEKRISLQKAIKSYQRDQKEDNDLLKRGIINRAEFNKRVIESEAAIAKNRLGVQQLNAQIKGHLLTNTRLGGEYKKLTIQLEAARTRYKDLAASGTASNQVLRQQERVFNDLNKKVTTIDKAVGQFQRNVGNYSSTFAAAGQSLRSFLGAFGLVTGVALFARTLREVVSLNVEFAAQNSRLQAVMGATSEEVRVLTEQQRKLGETTAFTALQYAQLQTEFAKLGFPIDEIEKMTESTAQASIAMGSDLKEQAELTGTVLRAFGLDASRASEVNDQLSKSTTVSALDFRKLADSLPYVATNAKLLGFSLDETLAIMGRLSNTGLQASTIGTSLRSIFLKLSDSSSELSKRFKEPVRDLPSFISGLRKLQEEGTDLGEALELSDKLSVSAFASLLSGVDSVDALSKSIQNANGFTNELADTVMDNLRGDFILLTSAAQELGRSLGEAADGGFRSIVQSATVFIKLLMQLPSFIRENKDLFIALGVALIGLNFNLIKTAASALLMDLNLKRMAIAQKLATISTRSLTAALLANPLGIIIAGFAALAIAISVYDRNSRRALEVEKQREKLNENIARSTEATTKAQKDLNVSVEDWLKMSEAQRKSAMEQRDFTIRQAQANVVLLKTQKERLEKQAKELTLWQKIGVFATRAWNPVAQGAQKASFEIDNASKATEGMDDAIVSLEKEIEALTHLFDDNTKAVADNTEEKKKASIEAQKAQLDLDKFRLEQQAKIEEEIISNEKNALEKRLAASTELEKLRGKIADVERKKDLLNGVKNQAELVLIEEETQAKKTDAAIKGQKEREKLIDDDSKLAYEEGLKRIQIEEDTQKAITSRAIAEFKRRNEEEAGRIKQNVLDGLLTRKEGDKLLRDFEKQSAKELMDLQLAALEDQLMQENDVYFKERKKLVEDSYLDEAEKILAIQALEAESAEEKAAIAQKIHELRMGFIDNLFENNKHLLADEIKTLLEVQAYYESFGGAIMDIFASISASRIQHIDSQIAAVERQTAREIELAGDNERAKSQIEKRGEQKRLQLEKKKREEQRKAAIREKAFGIISVGIQTAINVAEAFPVIPVMIAAAALGALQIAAIASKPIPQFEKGTLSAPGGLAIVGEKGAELMVSPSGEHSLTPDTATLMPVPRGTQIIPHDETMQRLALGALSSNGGTQQRTISDPALLNEVKQLNQNIKNIKQPKQPSLVRNGSTLYAAIEAKKNHTKIVRDINLGKWW